MSLKSQVILISRAINTRLKTKAMTNHLQSPAICQLRDWSLITGRVGLHNGRGGGHVKFYPPKRGGAKKVLAMLKEGAQQVLG